MATINVRSRADASNAYRVVWREGGRRAGPQQSETFSDRAEAERFKAAVELAGHLSSAGSWLTAPPGALFRCRC